MPGRLIMGHRNISLLWYIISGDIHVISDNLDENGTPVQPSVFNPDSPHAFVPPDYNSLPKDPPKYQDLYTQQAYGNVNQAYAASEANPTEMTSMVAAPAREAAGNDLIAGVHGHEDNTARNESNQGDLPEDPPPSYTESQAVCPPTAGDQGDTVVMQNETEAWSQEMQFKLWTLDQWEKPTNCYLIDEL